ncbi:metallophosphoesterase family protein [Niabella sp. W65]|nr:metallophosphoesterase family protein [Niabella sp. W65]MCH7365025.1 metallophosphoesterase family protein [Niabella sp. W65]
MKVLVISDIHGNLPALEFVLKEERNVDLIISLGDVVNYGPWSNECVDLLDTQDNIILIRGNHEEAFLSGIYPGNNEIAKAFFNFCYPKFDRKEIIENYLDEYWQSDYCFTHTINDQYIYEDSNVVISKNYFIGHSHRMFRKISNGFQLINVGSVGQNRVNIDEINYAVLYTENKKIELKRKGFRQIN